MNEKPKLKKGDKVEVVNYGHAVITSDPFISDAFKGHWIDGNPARIDIHSSLVGKTGVIIAVDNGIVYGDGRIVFSYTLDGDDLHKSSPYYEDQLKLIE